MATDIIVSSIRIASLTLVLLSMGGCHRRTYYTPPPIKGLYFDARAVVVADSLVVTAHAANTSHRYVRVEFDTCREFQDLSFELSHGRVVWDSRRWEAQRLKAVADSSGQSYGPVCAGSVISTQLSPGSVIPFVARTPLPQILGDSLKGGPYRVTVRLLINGREIKGLKAGDVEFPPPNTR